MPNKMVSLMLDESDAVLISASLQLYQRVMESSLVDAERHETNLVEFYAKRSAQAAQLVDRVTSQLG